MHREGASHPADEWRGTVKKTLLVVALALLLTLVAAAPALAWQTPTPPEPGNAYVYPMAEAGYGLHLWWEVDAAGLEIDHWGNTDAIPAAYNIWVVFGWASPIRGTVQNLPRTLLYDSTIKDVTTGDVVWPTSALDFQSYWTILYRYPDNIPAFNKASAPCWERDWYVELPSLDSGSYSGSMTETVTRVVTDSSFIGETWSKHAQQRPLKARPGTTTYTFAFTVGP